MATVILDFVPPEHEGYTTLQVWESATEQTAPGALAQSFAVDPVNYPTRMTVTNAASATNWFSIRWLDAAGGATPYSDPIQGGTTTLVGILVNRIMLRVPSANENIILQTVEAVVAEVMGTSDPYSVDPATVSYRLMEGMTMFAMGRALMYEMAESSRSTTGSGWTAGLVAMKSDSGSSVEINRGTIDWFLKEAARLLGLSYSRIAYMDIVINQGFSEIVTADISRLLIEVE